MTFEAALAILFALPAFEPTLKAVARRADVKRHQQNEESGQLHGSAQARHGPLRIVAPAAPQAMNAGKRVQRVIFLSRKSCTREGCNCIEAGSSGSKAACHTPGQRGYGELDQGVQPHCGGCRRRRSHMRRASHCSPGQLTNETTEGTEITERRRPGKFYKVCESMDPVSKFTAFSVNSVSSVFLYRFALAGCSYGGEKSGSMSGRSFPWVFSRRLSAVKTSQL